MKAYQYRHKLKTLQLLLTYYDGVITQYMQVLSVKSYFFLIQKASSSAEFTFSFFLF